MDVPFPMFTTNVPGMGLAGTQSPRKFCTCRPSCGDACKSLKKVGISMPYTNRWYAVQM